MAYIQVQHVQYSVVVATEQAKPGQRIIMLWTDNQPFSQSMPVKYLRIHVF